MSTTIHTKLKAGASVVALAAAIPFTAAAQSSGPGITEIIVTAQKRAENLQEVPVSINAFGSDQIAELRIQTASDIVALSPGVFVASGGPNPIFSIRGISLNDTFANNNPTVGVYVDEVIQPFTPMLKSQLFDMERVEVLKGPQGTLYGKNTTGGAINLITKKPSQEFDAYATIGYSRYNRFELEGAVGGGVSDDLAIRLAGKTVQQSGGWQTNAFTGEKLGDVESYAVRAQFLYTPNEDLEMLLKLGLTRDTSDAQQREHVGYYAGAFGAGGNCQAALDGYYDPTTCVDFLGYSDPTEDRRTIESAETYGHESDAEGEDLTLKIDYDLGPVTLTSITSYYTFDRVLGDDSDGAALVELDSRFTDKIDSFTQELRFTSNESTPFSYVAGLYYSWDKIDGQVLQALDEHIFQTRVDTSWVQKTESYAAFGQVGYDVTDRLTLTAGLRYTDEKRRYTYDSFDLDPFGTSSGLPTPVAGIVDEVSEDQFSGKVGIDFAATDDVMLYASASKGFKSGGFKGAIAFNPDELAPFEGETVYAYEAGVKSVLADGRMKVNAAAFYYDWKDFQAMVTEIRSGINVIVLSNAGDARVYGAEMEVEYMPVDTLYLRASANLMDSKIKQFNSAPGADDYTGNRLANTPEFTFSGTARWDTPLQGDDWGVYVMADTSYRSKVYYSLANRGLSSEDSYWLVNGRVGVEDKEQKWEVAFWAKNIFNKFYVSHGYDNWGGIFPSQNFLGEPATYGLTATYRY